MTTGRRARYWARDALAAALVVLGVWLAWQATREMLLVRLPPQTALTIAPASPLALSRAAEAEFEAGRPETAARLAREALSRAPFDVRALRVAGMVEAKSGDAARGEALVTLAGNWSLRDGRAHLWLLEHNLRRGAYGSGFAHAETLIRRRPAVQPVLFELFTDVALADRRAVPALTQTVAADPPWRPAYVAHLSRDPMGQLLAAELAYNLAGKPGAFDAEERATLYGALVGAQRYEVLRVLRDRLEGQTGGVIDPGFSQDQALGPLGWSFHANSGFTSERIAGPDESSGAALHLTSDGYAGGVAADQLLLLRPGSYRLRARWRIEQGQPGGRVAWTLTCLADGGAPVRLVLTTGEAHRWRQGETAVQVPPGCAAQRLALTLQPGERRRTLELWTDGVQVVAAR